MSRRTRTRLYLATLSLLAAAPPLRAANYYFVGPSGSAFSDPANWSTSPAGPGGTPPTSADVFGVDFVTPASAAPFDLLLDASPNGVTLGNVLVSGADVTGGPLAVNAPASAATIEARSFSVGPNVSFNQAGGALRAGGNTIVFSGTSTTYSLSGTGSLYASTIRFSDGVVASQSDGSVSAATNFILGGSGSHAVSYSLSGGTLGGDGISLDGPAAVSLAQTGGSAGGFYEFTVGRNASYSLAAGTLTTSDGPLYVGAGPHLTGTYAADAGSTLTQTGGTASLRLTGGTDALVVNANPSGGAPAVYAMSGGSLLSPKHASMTVGDTAAGTFAQSGGTVGTASPYPDSSSPDAVYLGKSAGGAGTYSLSGTGTLNTRSLHVGYAGAGTLVQTGGTLAVLNSAGPLLSLATNPGSTATYTLAGGTVSFSQTPSTFTVADSGTASVTQTSGTVGNAQVRGGLVAAPTYLYLAKSDGSSASYSLSGTDSRVYAAYEYLGNAGTASFSQSGGVHEIEAGLYLAYNPGSAATYTLSGGQLRPALTHVAESGTATLDMSGGTLSTGNLSLAVNPGSAATLNISGGYISTYAPASTVGRTDLGVAGNATILHTGGTLDTRINGTTALASLPGSTASYSLSGTGALLAYHLLVGERGSASLHQSGGTNTVTTSLALASQPGSSATYNLSGGTLSAGTLIVGRAGSAYLRQTGGTHTAGALTIAAQSGSSGVYDLVGGALSAANVTNNGTFYMQAPASFAGHAFTNNGSATFDGPQSWSAGSTFANTLVAFFHSDPGSPTAATLNVASASPDWAPVVFDAPATHLASLTLSAATHASVPAASPGTPPRLLSTRALSITDSAQLDLADNTLLIDYAGSPSPADTIRAYLLDGRLTTSAADPTHRLGYLDSGSTLTAFLALAGDANLDGRLTPDDYALLDRAFARNLSNAHWSDGDFNYDGTVDQQDYLLIDSTYGQSQGLSPALLSMRESQFGAAYISQLIAAVPEPASLAYLFATLPFLTRRQVRAGGAAEKKPK